MEKIQLRWKIAGADAKINTDAPIMFLVDASSRLLAAPRGDPRRVRNPVTIPSKKIISTRSGGGDASAR